MMNIDGSGDSDECERLLRTPLKTPERYSFRDQKHVKRALKWYRGNADTPLSLIEWMTVCRVVGEALAIRLDMGEEHHYLQFDAERNRVVIIDPNDNAQVPVEEADVKSVFDNAVVSLVPSRQMEIKEYDSITAVTHPDHGTKIVLGTYDDRFIQYTEDGDEIEFEPKTTFTLPEEMTPSEIDAWLNGDAATEVKDIVRTNHERNWDS